MLRGALTAGLLCSSIQMAWNGISIARIRFVSSSPSRLDSSLSAHSSLTHEDVSAPSLLDQNSLESQPPPPPATTKSIVNFITSLSPVQRLSDEQYLEVLRKQKAKLESQLQELEGELSSEQFPKDVEVNKVL